MENLSDYNRNSAVETIMATVRASTESFSSSQRTEVYAEVVRRLDPVPQEVINAEAETCLRYYLEHKRLKPGTVLSDRVRQALGHMGHHFVDFNGREYLQMASATAG